MVASQMDLFEWQAEREAQWLAEQQKTAEAQSTTTVRRKGTKDFQIPADQDGDKKKGYAIKELIGHQAESKTNPTFRQYCVWVDAVVECNFDCKSCIKEMDQDVKLLEAGERPKDKTRNRQKGKKDKKQECA